MAAGYSKTINRIRNGEPVSAGPANRPIDQLFGNTEYLRRMLEAIEAGQALFLRDVTVESAALPGMVVYYNTSTAQFERALSAVDVDPTTQEFVLAATALPWGVIARKVGNTGTLADLVLKGVVDLDLSSAVDGTIAAGLYYLSGSSPGKLVQQRPAVGVEILLVGEQQTDGTYRCRVDPVHRELTEAHKHYRFDLVCRPAGDVVPPSEGEPHLIANENPAEEGWLPATHSSFNGLAPDGAKFGYNLAASALFDLWPPIPPEGAYLEFDRGEHKDAMGQAAPLGAAGLAIIDRNGIWWLSDCYGDVPWPTELDTDRSDSLSVNDGTCPRTTGMRLTLWFAKPTFQTTGTAVLSLRAKAGSGLTIHCPDTDDEATVGHLEINLDLGLLEGDDDRAGYLVVKEREDNQLHRGPVIESIRAGTTNVSIRSEVAPGSDGKIVGNAIISVEQDLNETELPVGTIRLNGATEEYYRQELAIGFPAGRNAGIRGRIHVPAKNPLPDGTQLKFRLLVLGRAAGSVPADALVLSYRRLPQPTEVLDPVALPLTDTDLDMDCTVTFSAANQYVLMESDPFDVLAGDIVLFSLDRVDDDAYAGDLHLLSEQGVLVTED